MTRLRRRALARLPMTESQVNAIYETAAGGVYAGPGATTALCESHERLRAELLGAMAMLAETEAAFAAYQKKHPPAENPCPT